MNLREIKKSVGALPHGKLMKLDVWMRDQVRASESRARGRATAGRVTRQGRPAGNKSYCLERVRCGKENCKCARGELHGPYWYAYWAEGGKSKSQYVGKKLPRHLARRLSARGARQS